jgi:hypothetical protein
LELAATVLVRIAIGDVVRTDRSAVRSLQNEGDRYRIDHRGSHRPSCLVGKLRAEIRSEMAAG